MEFETKKVIIDRETRFVIVEKGKDKVLDDAQGYGYKTAQGAHKAGWYKFQRGKEKISSEKALAKQFWKQHPELVSEVEQNMWYALKDGISDLELEKQYMDEYNMPKGALKYLEF